MEKMTKRTVPVYSLQFMVEMAIAIVYNKWAEEV
jgi:hypothetical protein